MTTDATDITRKLKARRKALLQAYDDEDLHQLRVNIRRARALLKPHSDSRSVALRREWGELTRKTNAARDWDTLALYAEKVLPAADWQTLRPLLGEYRQRARGEVLETLRSDNWDAALAHWKTLVKQQGTEAFSEGTLAGGNRQAVKKMLRSSRKALERGDERYWHKLRIAVKNLRYKLDNTRLKNKNERHDLKALKRLCKQLQNALGEWHDTVVHRELLAAAADDPRVLESTDSRRLLQALKASTEQRGRESLAQVTFILDRDARLLAAAAGNT